MRFAKEIEQGQSRLTRANRQTPKGLDVHPSSTKPTSHLWVLPAEIAHIHLQYHKWTPNLPFLVLPNEHQHKSKFIRIHQQQIWACHRRQDTTITLKFSEGGIRLLFQYLTSLVTFASTTMTANNGQSTDMKAACSYLNGEPQIQSIGNSFPHSHTMNVGTHTLLTVFTFSIV